MYLVSTVQSTTDSFSTPSTIHRRTELSSQHQDVHTSTSPTNKMSPPSEDVSSNRDDGDNNGTKTESRRSSNASHTPSYSSIRAPPLPKGNIAQSEAVSGSASSGPDPSVLSPEEALHQIKNDIEGNSLSGTKRNALDALIKFEKAAYQSDDVSDLSSDHGEDVEIRSVSPMSTRSTSQTRGAAAITWSGSPATWPPGPGSTSARSRTWAG